MRSRREALSSILKNKTLTEFEKKVYRASLDIPKGEVRSYKWLAIRAGSPKACRAVGNALNKNPYPILVPCHRVVRSDGSMGGFAGGVAAKKRLLLQEGIDCEGGRCYNRKRRS